MRRSGLSLVCEIGADERVQRTGRKTRMITSAWPDDGRSDEEAYTGRSSVANGAGEREEIGGMVKPGAGVLRESRKRK